MRGNRILKLILTTVVAFAAPLMTMASGPLLMFDGANRIPYRYDTSVPVRVYTDLGPFRTLNPAISNERADEITAFAFQQWSDVPTSSFQADVVGDFSLLGLPDINATNALDVLNTFNGGGIFVIYDTDGSILQNVFGVSPFTTLGIASPEVAAPGSETILESWVVLNGRGVNFTDPDGVAFAGVFTHEFGHSINLAHTQVNGAVGFYADSIGPTDCTGLPYDGLPTPDQIETMYPFLNVRLGTGGSGEGQSTVNQKDDMTGISDLYPAPGWRDNTGSITGRMYMSDGETEVTGVNLIARNVNDPFADAVSAMSGDYTRGSIGPDGRFEIHGLTPGGQYVLYADAIRAGGFPTDHPQILPGPEEFFNGDGENGEALRDDPCQSVMLEAVPGNTDEANIIFNRVKNGPSITVIEAPGALATDISGDGKTVVGVFNGDAAPSFRWSEEDGFAVLGGTGGLARISQDGQHIVSNSVSPDTSRVQASFWVGGTDWQPIPVVNDPGPGCSNSMGLTLTAATGISAHGEAVSALGYDGICSKPRAFLWTESGGPTLLPVPDDTRQASANSLSADGNTVVGWRNLLTSGSRRATRWVNGEFFQIDGGSDLVGEANGVNPDGSAIVGQYLGTAREAWRWTEENGVESIGSLSGPGIATDVSDSGNIVVGFSGTSNRMAFMWMPETGIFSLDGFLRSQGVALGNFGLFTVTAISSDGSRITGWGTGPDNYYPWVVDLSKVVVTHAPPGSPSKARSIVVSFDSLQEHLAHGDTMGLTYR